MQLIEMVAVDDGVATGCLANSLDRLLTQQYNAPFLKHRVIARHEAAVTSGFSNLCIRVTFDDGGLVGRFRSTAGSSFESTCPLFSVVFGRIVWRYLLRLGPLLSL